MCVAPRSGFLRVYYLVHTRWGTRGDTQKETQERENLEMARADEESREQEARTEETTNQESLCGEHEAMVTADEGSREEEDREGDGMRTADEESREAEIATGQAEEDLEREREAMAQEYRNTVWANARERRERERREREWEARRMAEEELYEEGRLIEEELAANESRWAEGGTEGEEGRGEGRGMG